MSKIIKFGDDARSRIQKGLDILTDAVSATMGPRGRNAVLGRPYGPPSITKDGVTVAKEIDLTDVFENLGAQLVKEVAHKTAEDAGDGTTTATVLARAIYKEGLKLVAAGHDPMSLKRGIDKAYKAVVNNLVELSNEVSTKDQIVQVGTISANGEESIGLLLAEAMEKVGKDGVITIEEQMKGSDTTLDFVEGMEFERGWINPYFVTDADNMTAEYKNVLVLLHEKPISNLKQLLPLLQKISGDSTNNYPLLIIADSVDGEALGALLLNKTQGTFQSVAVKSPYIGDKKKAFLGDIAALTGATVIGDEIGKLLKDATTEDLGVAKSIKVTKHTTTIVEGQGDKDKIKDRISQIRNELETGSSYDTPFLQERLAKLTSGVAVINVGGNTELELREKKDRIDDALSATKAAVQEGIVPGGGVALLRAAEGVLDSVKATPEEQVGVKLLLKALEEPLRTITRNAGHSDQVIIDKVKNLPTDEGFNAATGVYENLIEAGVIDPAKVVRSALENAASVAGLMLTTEVLVVDDPEVTENNKS